MATVLIGTGFLGVLTLVASGTQISRQATMDTTAINLANNIHEASLRIPFDQIFTLNTTYTSAVDAQLAPIPNMGNWQQAVTVQYVDDDEVTKPVANAEPTVQITVAVNHNGQEAYRATWLMSK